MVVVVMAVVNEGFGREKRGGDECHFFCFVC